MYSSDLLKLSYSALQANRSRSVLTALGIAVGIAAVVLLTSMGEGLHRYMLAEFTQFGTNLIGISPGKSTTTGFSGAVISNVRPLTLEDEKSLRRLPSIIATVPVIQGNAPVEAGKRQRHTTVYGVGHAAPDVWQFAVAQGQFLPDDDPETARAFVVLGSKVKNELFPSGHPLGQLIRVGGYRFRVIGVMESKGQMLGFDLDDAVYIPAAKSMEMFNRDSLMEIDVLYASHVDADKISAQIKSFLTQRHGSEDFTIVTQEQMLEVLGSILNIFTYAVGALGGISLLVGAVGILTIMTISVSERSGEIGLLRALGASRRQILLLFLSEALVLSALGGAVGLLLGWSGAILIHTLVPALPTHTSWYFVLFAEFLSVLIGLLSSVIPAYRAARIDPIEALREE
jgi:putative ABC transport system permease protein